MGHYHVRGRRVVRAGNPQTDTEVRLRLVQGMADKNLEHYFYLFLGLYVFFFPEGNQKCH